MKPKDESFNHAPALNGNGYRREYSTMEPYASSIIKVITLRRRGTSPLGFSIRGGWEHGTGVFISEIVPGSIAQKQGLRVGDQIVRINGFSIHRAIHMEVLSLLKTCPGIVLKIKRVGILPVKERDKDPVTWKIVEPQNNLICSSQVTHSRVNGSTLENSIIVKVEISVPGTASLGCSIAKGPAELPGIFMCTVKEGGIADQAGLQVGDQILDMNGTSFHDLKLNEAVALMKSVKDIRLTVKKGAGISLFLDNGSTSQLSCSSNKNEDTISSTRSLSDGLSTTLKDHEFSGSCSSKSEGSSFQSSVSSDSEKDYSISEESAFEGLPKNGKWPPPNHKKNPSSASTVEDDSWILEEKRSLEEDRRKLAEEKRRLEEEKRKLELEKTSSSSCSSQPTSLEESSFKDNSFLNELQKVAARMNTRENKGDDVLRNGVPIKTTRAEVFKGKRGKEDAIKRMQHEMLMEEFRAAHRKMFGQQSVLGTEEKEEKEKVEEESFHSRMIVKGKSKPPPPPPKTTDNNNKECQKITVNGQVPGLQAQTLSKFEKVVSLQEKPAEKEIVKPPTPTNGFRVTVSDRSRQFENGNSNVATKTKSTTLVEVTPWSTRL